MCPEEKVTIFDKTEVNLVAFRRTIYLAIQSRYRQIHTVTLDVQSLSDHDSHMIVAVPSILDKLGPVFKNVCVLLS